MTAAKGKSDDPKMASESDASASSKRFEQVMQKFTELRTKEDANNKDATERANSTWLFNFENIRQTPTDEFRAQLEKGNWMEADNNASVLANSKIYSGDCYSQPQDYIPLGRFKKSWLALQLSTNGLIPTPISGDYMEAHNYNIVLSGFMTPGIMGARYVSDVDGKKETLVFVQLGNIFSRGGIEDSDEELTEDGRWQDTGYVLALEILENGSAGKFYIICNLTNFEVLDPEDHEGIYNDPWLRQFCTEEPPITVAQVEGQGLNLLKDNWKQAREEEDIQLRVLSGLIPEIVETGFEKVDGHRRHVILYPELK